MKCASCGKEIPEGNIFCPLCGKEAQIISDQHVLEDDLLKVLMETEDVTGIEIPERTAYEEEQRQIREKEERRRQKIELQKKKKQKRILAAVLVIVIVVVAAAVIFGVRKANSFTTLYNKAEVAYHTGKYEEAIAYCAKALETRDEEARVTAFLLMGDCYLEMGEYDKADPCYQNVLQQDAYNTDAYHGLLQIYIAQDDYVLIEELYHLALESENPELIKLFDDVIVPVPEVNIKGGIYEDVVELCLSTDKDMTIYYTLDGSEPTAESEKYEDPIELNKKGTVVLKAISVNTDGNASSVLEETYEMAFVGPEAPEITPDGGTFADPTQVSIYSQEDVTMYYTWDGSTPDKGSAKYTKPIDVLEGNNILSVIAIHDRTGEKSTVTKANFIYYPAVSNENGTP